MFSVYVKDSVGVALWLHLCVPQRRGHAGGGASEDPRCTAGGVPGARQEQSNSPLCLAPPPLPPSPGSDFLVLTSWFLTWRPVACVCFQQHDESPAATVVHLFNRRFSRSRGEPSAATSWFIHSGRFSQSCSVIGPWCIVGFAVSVLWPNLYLFVYLKGEILFESRLLWSHGVSQFLAS